MDARDKRSLPGKPGLVDFLAASYGLDKDAQSAIQAALEMRSIARGKVFAGTGTSWKEIMYLQSGAARSRTLTAGGEEITYFLFFEGSWICDLRSYTEKKPSRFEFEALEDLQVSVLSRTRLEGLMVRFPVLVAAMFDLALQSYVHLDKRMESFMLQSPSARYQSFMSHHRDHAGRIPQYILASYLGVKPESLSRIKRKIASKIPDINPDQ